MDSSTMISPHLQRLLEEYQSSALNSLRGPSPLSPVRPNAERPLTVEKFGFRDSLLDILASLTFRAGSSTTAPAVMTPRDHSAERHDTLLEGEVISCFNVGGEKRMCLPQILSTVLRDYDLPEIHKACSELHIYCSPCSPDQLDVLKMARVLPFVSTNCSLVTKTDAERLCNYLSTARRVRRSRLTGSSSSVPMGGENSRNALPVYHECFGRCRGRYFDDKYASLSAECIACDECNELFAPDRFVLHSHRDHETKVCHWGFDSANWRCYLHLVPEVETDKSCSERLKNMKAKFYNVGGVTPLPKRSLDGASPLPQVKRPRCDAAPSQMPFVEFPLPNKLHSLVPQQQQVAPPVSALPPTFGGPLPSVYLCDPLVLAYYHLAASARFNNNVCSSPSYPTTSTALFPLPGSFALEKSQQYSTITTNNIGHVGCAELTSREEAAAAAALLKLSPQTKDATTFESKSKQVAPDSSSHSFVGCNEPLKKHILHRTQSKQQMSPHDEKTHSQTLPLNTLSSSLHSTLDEDTRAIDSLLRQYIADAEALRIVQTKLDETRRIFDAELQSLSSQNNILQREIAYLRNKQQSTTATTLHVPTCGAALTTFP